MLLKRFRHAHRLRVEVELLAAMSAAHISRGNRVEHLQLSDNALRSQRMNFIMTQSDSMFKKWVFYDRPGKKKRFGSSVVKLNSELRYFYGILGVFMESYF